MSSLRGERSRFIPYLKNSQLAGITEFITVSKFHRKWALDLRIAGTEKLQAIPNGIPDILETEGATRQEIRASLGVFDDDVMLFTQGRLAPEKGLEDLIAAVAATRGCLSLRLHVMLAGDGPLRPVLEQNVRLLGLTDQVRFLGFRPDIGMLLKAADIVALPSFREGLSIALLESMSAGRAIIATSLAATLRRSAV
jgi:glycosyltransferase involved in cell wall biosynthesis